MASLPLSSMSVSEPDKFEVTNPEQEHTARTEQRSSPYGKRIFNVDKKQYARVMS